MASRPSVIFCAAAVVALIVSGCGGGSHAGDATAATTSSKPTATTVLPGVGKPAVTIGDKNFTEQFILGELYYQALSAQGFTVLLNRNIGPTDVTLRALQSGTLTLYPEYLDLWNGTIFGDYRDFRNGYDAYQAAQRHALRAGLALLDPTPFSDTDAIAVTYNYASDNHLKTIEDLRKVAFNLTIGAAPQFEQNPTALPALEQAYGFLPAAFKPLAIGEQYQALDQGLVQAADVTTTDPQLLTGDYVVLSDPHRVFGYGNVVPVTSPRVLDEEGPVFAGTINRIDALLTLHTIRELNAQVDVYGKDPAVVAKEFLIAHGLMPPSTGS